MNNVLHKHIPTLQTLAEKTHPEDGDAQEGFILDHLTQASKNLSLAGHHEDNALEAYESYDVEEKPEPVKPHVNAPRTESPIDAPKFVAPIARKASKTQKRKR